MSTFERSAELAVMAAAGAVVRSVLPEGSETYLDVMKIISDAIRPKLLFTLELAARAAQVRSQKGNKINSEADDLLDAMIAATTEKQNALQGVMATVAAAKPVKSAAKTKTAKVAKPKRADKSEDPGIAAVAAAQQQAEDMKGTVEWAMYDFLAPTLEAGEKLSQEDLRTLLQRETDVTTANILCETGNYIAADADLRDAVAKNWHRYRGGAFWAGWYAYVTFLRDVCDWEHEALENFKHDEKTALNAGWIWLGAFVSVISDRPSAIHRQENRLHCTNGPAAAWRDGWKLWYIDGIRVDEQIVMTPELQTIPQIDGESNADVKTIRVERFGWHRYLKETGAEVLDEGPNEVEGTHEVLFKAKDGSHRFVATCVTGRIVTMGLPSEIKTRQAAQKWLGADKKRNIIART
jgi:hypothetical protein